MLANRVTSAYFRRLTLVATYLNKLIIRGIQALSIASTAKHAKTWMDDRDSHQNVGGQYHKSQTKRLLTKPFLVMKRRTVFWMDGPYFALVRVVTSKITAATSTAPPVQRKAYPLLFDVSLQRKKAYQAVVNF